MPTIQEAFAAIAPRNQLPTATQVVSEAWDEGKHPRERGRFASKGTVAEPPEPPNDYDKPFLAQMAATFPGGKAQSVKVTRDEMGKINDIRRAGITDDQIQRATTSPETMDPLELQAVRDEINSRWTEGRSEDDWGTTLVGVAEVEREKTRKSSGGRSRLGDWNDDDYAYQHG